MDELRSAGIVLNRGPSSPTSYTQTFEYDSLSTRRLTRSNKDYGGGLSDTEVFTYDVFGNRVKQSLATTRGGSGVVPQGRMFELGAVHSVVDSNAGQILWWRDVTVNTGIPPGYVPPSCANVPDTMVYGSDNRLLQRWTAGCTGVSFFSVDQAGNRIAQADTGQGQIHFTKMTYTARNQLYYSFAGTSEIGAYDANWHWYDASGMRVITHVQASHTYYPAFSPDSGFRTYYSYDGSDVALTITKAFNGGYNVTNRYMVGGVDQAMVGRLTGNAGTQNLALVDDDRGSTVVAVKRDGTAELQATYYDRGPFGTPEGASVTGSTNSQTGFTGASSPNTASGFTYLRNRWYDAQTGRFLTQDPIGLAGGENLYAYAGNNPVMFTDPFGLCPPMTLAEVFQCTGQMLQPAQKPLEIMGTIAMLPLTAPVQEARLVGLGLEAPGPATGIARARWLGQLGEDAAGIGKNTQRIPSVTGAAYRVPDGLANGVLSEVKNVRALTRVSNQLRDFAAYSQNNGLRFDLYIRRSTQLSRSVREFIHANNIHLTLLP